MYIYIRYVHSDIAVFTIQQSKTVLRQPGPFGSGLLLGFSKRLLAYGIVQAMMFLDVPFP